MTQESELAEALGGPAIALSLRGGQGGPRWEEAGARGQALRGERGQGRWFHPEREAGPCPETDCPP